MGAVTATYRVLGMSCDHCVRAVSAELGALPAVEAVSVQLVPGGVSLVTVTGGTEPPVADVVAALEEAGYELAAGSGP